MILRLVSTRAEQFSDGRTVDERNGSPGHGDQGFRPLSRNQAGQVDVCECCGRWQLWHNDVLLIRDRSWFARLARGLRKQLVAPADLRAMDDTICMEVSTDTIVAVRRREVADLVALLDRANQQCGGPLPMRPIEA